MQLMLRRSHRSRLFGHGLIYSTAANLVCSQAEIAAIYTYVLEGTLLYSRLEMIDGGTGVLGLLYRRSFDATNMTVTVEDAIVGKRLEFDNLTEALALEDQLAANLARFSDLLDAALRFHGIEILPL